MKAKIFYLTMALIMALMAVIAPASTARAAIINVPTDYPTIQAAVNAASPGDTIVVAAGTYNETVNIDKSLTLEGAQAGVDARGRSGSESVINADRKSVV
jgi:nitrous oxidase accessory protein NosD